MNERDFLPGIASKARDAKVANLVYLFSEVDINSNLDNASLPHFLEFIAALHKAGYGIAVLLAGKAPLLDTAVYEQCDAFFVDFSDSAGDVNMDTRIRSELHALVERLLKYGKPIIGYNLVGWTAIELVVGSGITYVTSDTFEPYDTMFHPLNPRSIDRLSAIKKGN
jgi:hypothetical protein